MLITKACIVYAALKFISLGWSMMILLGIFSSDFSSPSDRQEALRGIFSPRFSEERIKIVNNEVKHNLQPDIAFMCFLYCFFFLLVF